MSVSATKPYVQKAYDDIKVTINDANRQIRNFNLKTIAKIVALIAVFTLGGTFGVLACIKMGIAMEIAGLAVLPFMLGGALAVMNFKYSNDTNMDSLVKNLNEDIKEKLKNYTLSIKDAVSLGSVDRYGDITIPKIQLDSFDRVNKKYGKDFRRHLPGFLQFSKPDSGTIAPAVLFGSLSALAGTMLYVGTKRV
ncbi:MAG: hypothetical protein K1000chlam1_01426 [Candidatus Anoxychlamydiales bacterium]|nr:hypothetical protein [Candidatus Anoxychlamydiales bacterium]